MLWILIKCLIAVVALTLLGIVLPPLIIVFAAVVNNWDGTPGGGAFLVFMAWTAGILGAFAGFIDGFVLSVVIWERRKCEAGKPHIKTIYWKAVLCLASVSLLPGVICSAAMTGHDSVHIAIGYGFALLLLGLAVFCASFALKNDTVVKQEL
jgi:hypothetical protein